MIYPIYAIRDQKVAFDTQLILQANEAAAVRGFTYMINNPSGVPNFAPNDFDFYKIGEFNSETGEIKGIMPEFIVNGGSVISAK